jgi:hypothetical protein
VKLISKGGGLLVKDGKFIAVKDGTEACQCCDECSVDPCELTLRYVDENRCEDDVFDIFVYNPDDGPAGKVFVAELDMVSTPPGCCNRFCPQTTIDIPLGLKSEYISGDCKFGIIAKQTKSNCCGTAARFSVRTKDGSVELFGAYFNSSGTDQIFDLRAMCGGSKSASLARQGGVGSELSALLKVFFLNPDSNCDCKARAEYMNRMGAQWCRENIETINGWLRDEAHKRGIPFFDWLGRQVILRAIDSWEAKQMPLDQDGQT